ncbi:YgaP family membrane protein [Nocardioides sp.]|uniref:YgaP family membrane protein n=1 Tax=Nocardioides sp. TaxID=35761 RepID=UPI003D0F0C3C
MNLDRAVLAVAGSVVLLSVLLTVTVSTWWILLTAFVGLNLLQSSLTGFCPAAIVLRRFGVVSGCAFTSKEEVAAR